MRFILNNLINYLRPGKTQRTRSEAKFQALIKYAGDSIIIIDPVYRIIEVNESACQLLKYSRQELQRMTMHDLISPDEKIIFLERTRVVDEEGSSLHERKLKRKDGCFVDTEVNVCRVKEVGYFAIIRDITERKKTETALRLSEEKFHSLINHAADAIFMVAGDGLIFDVNLGASELLLYTREELIGKSVLDLHPPEAREAIPGLWGRLKADKYLKDERILVRNLSKIEYLVIIIIRE